MVYQLERKTNSNFQFQSFELTDRYKFYVMPIYIISTLCIWHDVVTTNVCWTKGWKKNHKARGLIPPDTRFTCHTCARSKPRSLDIGQCPPANVIEHRRDLSYVRYSARSRFRTKAAVHPSERNHTVQFHGWGRSTHVKFPAARYIGWRHSKQQDTGHGKMRRKGISIIAREEPIDVRSIASASVCSDHPVCPAVCLAGS